MKKSALTFLLFLTVLSGFSQEAKQRKGKTTIEFITPPNCRHLYDNVFIDETEIYNMAYLEYLFYISNDSTEEFYLSQLPDSTCWQVNMQPKDSIDPYTYHYFRYPGFRYFPVVGVSYEQAVNYCKWRSDIVNKTYRDETFMKKYPGLTNYEVTVEFRLPTKEEWEYAASGALDTTAFPYGIKRPLKDKSYTFKIGKNSCTECLDTNNITYSTKDIIHKMEFNVMEDYYFDVNQPGINCNLRNSFILNYIYEHPGNNFGLYEMIGNVAEMTEVKGIAKGGSFRNSLSDFTINTDFLYDSPKEWLGFRCVAVVHMRRKVGKE